jgi:hypothetical protein
MPPRRIAKLRSTVSVGNALEDTVRLHYEALGYRVTPNINLFGHQVDLLASKYVSGAGLFTMMIEVKARGESAVGINDVTPFRNTATDLLARGRIQAAVLVTDGSFSQDAQAGTEASPSIRFSTIAQLEHDLFNYSDSLLRLRYDYEASPLFTEYIPLEAQVLHSPVNDAATEILRWSRGTDPLLVVVGDFGSGKTTILERVQYQQALIRISNANARFPILLRLRKLLHFSSLWTFVAESLRDSLAVSPSRNVFEGQLKAGKFLVLLDGFDEVHSGAGARDRAQYLERLMPLLASGSPCVMSTRPTYFQSFEEMASALSVRMRQPTFKLLTETAVDVAAILGRLRLQGPGQLRRTELQSVLTLTQLTDAKITQYLRQNEPLLRRSVRCSAAQAKKLLYKIYDLEDLMRRPLLLHMVVATIAAGAIDLSRPDTSLGPAGLYDLYTHIAGRRDASKQYLSVDQRLEACRRVALEMLRRGSSELHHGDVLVVLQDMGLHNLRDRLGEDGDMAMLLERCATDVRLCSFLSHSETGSLRFAHKSFFEFFVAQALVLECQVSGKTLGRFSKARLGREMVYFLASFARERKPFGQVVTRGLTVDGLTNPTGERRAVFQLCARIAFAAGTFLERRSVSDTVVEGVDLRRASLSKCSFARVRFDDVTVRDLRAEEWRIEDCAGSSFAIDSSRFVSSTLQLKLKDGTLRDCQLDECHLTLTGDRWELQATRVLGGTARLGGSGIALDARFVGCRPVLLDSSLSLTGATSVVFASCVVVSKDGGPWYGREVSLEFDACLLCGVRLEEGDIADLVARRAETVSLRVRVQKCRGLVLTRKCRPEAIARMRQLHPDLLVCDEDQLVKTVERWEKRLASVKRRRGRSWSGPPEEGSDQTSLLLTSVAAVLRENALDRVVTGLLSRVLGVVAR